MVGFRSVEREGGPGGSSQLDTGGSEGGRELGGAAISDRWQQNAIEALRKEAESRPGGGRREGKARVENGSRDQEREDGRGG